MTFEEYLHSASDETRQNIIKLMASYGDPNTVLSEVSAIVPCVQNQSIDVRINEKYFLWHRNKGFLSNAHTTLIRMNHVKYYYYSYKTIGLVGGNGVHREFEATSGEEMLRIANKLHAYIRGFESVPCCDPKEKAEKYTATAGIYCNAQYVLQNDTISLIRTSLFGRKKDVQIVEDIRDIIWCQQLEDRDSDGDSYLVDLYFLSKKEPRRLYFRSNHDGFKFVLELKKRTPHLLYGYNKSYEEIYKCNPAELLTIGRSQANAK